MISRLVLNLRSLSSPGNQCNSIRGTALQFNHQSLSTSKQLEMIWTRTLDDFTEDNINAFSSETGHAAFDEAPLSAETIPHGNDNIDYSSREV